VIIEAMLDSTHSRLNAIRAGWSRRDRWQRRNTEPRTWRRNAADRFKAATGREERPEVFDTMVLGARGGEVGVLLSVFILGTFCVILVHIVEYLEVGPGS
jgi:hypothetical protein